MAIPRLIPERWRRPLGIVGLIAGLLAAWASVRRDVVGAKASLLLTHLERHEGDATLGRDRLIGLRLSVPTAETPFVVERIFARGSAPEATMPIHLELGPDVTRVGIRCAFDIGGSEPLYGYGLVRIERQEALQVLDAGDCAAAEETAP
ncbi:MAG: hypothetical protein H6747_10005 [Deltaproteobacteria bacterium]|nr:hypothetical protein [Deltaproteobacteria bacterium]